MQITRGSYSGITPCVIWSIKSLILAIKVATYLKR